MIQKIKKNDLFKVILLVLSFVIIIILLLVIYINERNSYQQSFYDSKNFFTFFDLVKEESWITYKKRNDCYNKIHETLLAKLDTRFLFYFKNRTSLRLLDFTSGDIFENGEKDYMLIALDNSKLKAEIIFYNSKDNIFNTMYYDIKVINGLKNASCKFSVYSVDFEVGETIAYRTLELCEFPEKYAGNLGLCSFGRLFDDNRLNLKYGCFAKGFNQDTLKKYNSLCISINSDSSEILQCFKYDKTRNVFIVFYKQNYLGQ